MDKHLKFVDLHASGIEKTKTDKHISVSSEKKVEKISRDTSSNSSYIS